MAKWKKLIAKIVTTKERFKAGDPNQSDSSPIPGIELYDIVDGKSITFEAFQKIIISIIIFYQDREVSLAATLILENFAIPSNHTEVEKPLSRYSSSETILRLDGHSGSVAEKALMFELTANLQSNQNHLDKTNGSKSPSPKTSPQKKRTATKPDKPQENNDNTPNVTNGTDTKVTSSVQDMVDFATRSWSDIMMEAESGNFS